MIQRNTLSNIIDEKHIQNKNTYSYNGIYDFDYILRFYKLKDLERIRLIILEDY